MFTQAKESISNGYLPMGLASKAKVLHPVAKGSILTYKDVELDTTLFSYKIRKGIEEKFSR